MIDCLALMPAAGLGTRLALAQGCKEMLAVPDVRTGVPEATWMAPPDPAVAAPTQLLADMADEPLQRPVCDYLLDQFLTAGLHELMLLRRASKTDLRDHLARQSFTLHDVVIEPTPGTAHTLLEGVRRASDRTVAFGFPDMILSPPTLLRETLALLESQGADLSLALIPPLDASNWDMATLDGDRITRLDIRPGPTTLEWGWCLAAWRPTFGDWLATWLSHSPAGYADGGEVAVGHAFAAAIEDGLHVVGARNAEGYVLDVGTPRGLDVARSLMPRATGS